MILHICEKVATLKNIDDVKTIINQIYNKYKKHRKKRLTTLKICV